MNPGSRLGPYDILALIGSGGMGEVYRAHDARLGRNVAIKVLPAAFSDDPDRLRRFEQEARAAAALNHPNILHILDIGRDGATSYVVSELLEGETLRAQMEGAALPLSKAIDCARQTALGLAAAHAKGITHRDIKPENVFVTADGRVKILDFGLAKVRDESSGGSATRLSTEAGVVLGTVGYMSPEQVRALPVDGRSDIFSAGVVLFEMVTGARPFQGDSAVETMNAILKEDPPDLAVANPKVPASIGRIIRHCLEKSPSERFQSARDLAFALEALSGSGVSSDPSATAVSTSSGRANVREGAGRASVLPGVAGVVVGAALTAMALLFAIPAWRHVPEASARRLSVLPPPGSTLFDDASESAISPDGRLIVFRTGQSAGPGQAGTGSHLWLRSLDATSVRVIAGTEEAFLPFWAPDSRRIGFFMQGKLKTVALDTGAITIVCDTTEGRGATWNASDVIVFAPNAQGRLMRVSANGGEPQPVTTLDAGRHQVAHRFPWFLPDGRHFLFTALPSRNGKFETWVGSLDGSDTKVLMTAESAAIYAEPGYLLFMSRNGVAALHFDPRRLDVAGEPLAIGDAPGYAGYNYTGARPVSASDTGTLAYLAARRQNSKLVWIDGISGKEVGAVEVPPGSYGYVRIAPDARHAAVLREVSATEGEIWIVDLERGGAVRFTNEADGTKPVWSPGGTRIAFISRRNGGGDLYIKSANGAAPEQPVQLSPNIFRNLDDWSRDGRYILFDQLDEETGNDVWVLPLDGSSRATPYLNTRFHERDASFSPDGRWVAYTSDDSGTPELYVQSFPTPGEKYRVTTEGVLVGWWTAAGRILFARARDRQWFTVDVNAGPPFHTGPPHPLATLAEDLRGFDSLLGSKFLVTRPVGESVPASLTVVIDWMAALRKQ
ncbi:MAG TPA: protein kinase [Vicinamibacterales bacterium]